MPDFGKALKQLRQRDRQPYLSGMSPVAELSLSTQLRFLKSEKMLTYVPVQEHRRDVLPSGEVQSTPFGSHYLVRKAYGEDYYHGKIRISRFSVPELEQLMQLMKHRGAACARDRIIFLDTETTGVHGGTGICPFLIGVGYFIGDEFQVNQFFIRDFDEEPSMLVALAEMLRNFDLVITYNGASFDIPLVETRFALARLDSPFDHMGHFDLLTTARRLWRNGHGSCRLTALERLLSFVRGPDVPGADIPRVYFNFLQHRPSPELTGVFLHNAHDVVSLAALTIHACDRVSATPAALDEPLDLYSLAAIFENTADWSRAVRYYEMAIDGGLPERVLSKALESLALLHRRAGEHEQSLELCRRLMRFESFSFSAYEGVAIYYERIARNMESALRVVVEGLIRLDGLDSTPQSKRWRTLLQSRWKRLQQKVIGFPSADPTI